MKEWRKYNGYPNKETWLASLWLDEIYKSDSWRHLPANELAQSFERYVEGLAREAIIFDLIHCSLSRIDYVYILRIENEDD